MRNNVQNRREKAQNKRLGFAQLIVFNTLFDAGRLLNNQINTLNYSTLMRNETEDENALRVSITQSMLGTVYEMVRMRHAHGEVTGREEFAQLPFAIGRQNYIQSLRDEMSAHMQSHEDDVISTATAMYNSVQHGPSARFGRQIGLERAVRTGVEQANSMLDNICEELALGSIGGMGPHAEMDQQKALSALRQSLSDLKNPHLPQLSHPPKNADELLEASVATVMVEYMDRTLMVAGGRDMFGVTQRLAGGVLGELGLCVGRLPPLPRGRNSRQEEQAEADAQEHDFYQSIAARQMGEFFHVFGQVFEHVSDHASPAVSATFYNSYKKLTGTDAAPYTQEQYASAVSALSEFSFSMCEEMALHMRDFDGWAAVHALGMPVNGTYMPLRPQMH